mgnify:CR=1 FL=1
MNYSLYGLPEKVIHCKKCLMHNQKPFSVNEAISKIGQGKTGMPINEEGLCAACEYTSRKRIINWEEREKKLLEKLNKFRRNDGSYDCIVSGSGGKDSSMTSHLLKYKYGMHPLTITFSPLLYTNVGWRNMQNWISKGGFDNFLFSPNKKISKLLAREAFFNLYHPMQPFKFGIKSYAPKLAAKLGINLVMYGESCVEYGSGDNESDETPSYDKNFYINDDPVYLGGLSIEDVKRKYNFSQNDLACFLPVTSEELKDHELTVEHLGWYVKWDPQNAYYYAAENCGFEADEKRTDGTYGKYTGIDDKMESLHFYTHYIKFMIGRCRFDASHEIRNGHIEREEGISLAKRYEGELPITYLKDCLDYLGITEDEFIKRTDEARSPHLWDKDKEGNWIPIQELKEIKNHER